VGAALIELADSQADPESGAESPPPAKRRKSGNARSPSESVMFNNSNGRASNGQTDGHHTTNGVTTNGSVIDDKFKSCTDRDIIRIIGQQLREYGLQ
jgi:hypothetical protein